MNQRAQPFSCPAFSNMESNREALQGKASRKSDRRNCFLIRAILMVKKIHAWKSKAYSKKKKKKKKIIKKLKKYSHFQTITTNNSKQFFRFHIKQYWHFHGVAPKQYYILFQTSNNTDIFRELLVRNCYTNFQSLSNNADLFKEFLRN